MVVRFYHFGLKVAASLFILAILALSNLVWATPSHLIDRPLEAHQQLEPQFNNEVLPTSRKPKLSIQNCAALADQERLACYDQLALGLVENDRVKDENNLIASPAKLSTDNEKDEEIKIATTPAYENEPSMLESRWGLRDDTQTPLFNLQPYNPSYVLFAQHSSRVNRQPTSPSAGRKQSSYNDYRHVEAKFQLSVKSKGAHNILLPNDSLWFGYTQVSQWQVWSSHISRPFRATSYMPEFFYVMPIQKKIPATDWNLRMARVGVVHESNGQSNPLSRSWNRTYFGLGLDRPNLAIEARIWRRFSESAKDDDNPRITHYMGRADLKADWALPSGNNIGFKVASNLRDTKGGSVQLDYYFPLSRFFDMGDHLRGYVQVFHGYGETITDYNFRRTAVGIGVAIKEW